MGIDYPRACDTELPVSRSTSTPHGITMLREGPAMARQPFVVNEALREKVSHLAGLGVTQDDIASIIGCAPKTLSKHFRAELDRGVAEANAIIRAVYSPPPRVETRRLRFSG